MSLLLLALLLSPVANAGFDEFSDDFATPNIVIHSEELTLTLKGELEVELHDIEGKGGPGYDSNTDTLTLGTRSPIVEIDTFWLAYRVGLSDGLAVNSAVEFTTRGARVGSAWLDWRQDRSERMEHHVELGYHTPIVALDRRTERYPLAGTATWRSPELHAAYELAWRPARAVRVDLGGSLAMMRPLSLAGVQESTSQTGTINILTYGEARSYSGNAPVAGGRGRLTVHGAFAEGFGFVGSLAAQYGTDSLRSAFPNYRELPGAAAEDPDHRAWWWGGRVGYDAHGAHLLAEGILTREGLIRRQMAYAQASYRVRLRDRDRAVHFLEPVLRVERYRLPDGAVVQPSGRALRSTAPINAVSWDWDIVTAALLVGVWRDLVLVRAEADWIDEHNGVPDLDQPDEPFRNDEWRIQVEVRF
ncbi:MAG: hypothetical protein JXX28_00420 [Deltaproteobacteria bacterium]|nr:hypothetical protein [Deltaproteobacteria bacterium]